jgi:hypothetical protein
VPILLPLSVGPDLITIVGVASSAGATTPLTINKSAVGTLADGDVLIAVQSADNGASASITANTGSWTQLLALDSVGSSAPGVKMKVWGRTVTTAGSEPASWTWGYPATSDNVITVIGLRGANLTAVVGQIQTTATGQARVTPTVDHAGTAGSVMLAGATVDGPAVTTFTPPNDMTELADAQSTTWTAQTVARMFDPADPTGTKTFTPGTTVNAAGVQWALVIPPPTTPATFLAAAPYIVNQSALVRAHYW